MMIEEMKRWPWLVIAHVGEDGRQLIYPARSEDHAQRMIASDHFKFDARCRTLFEIVPSRWAAADL
ncbi:hypothetical protein [Streptosporangium roseum]|uniref:Uncharacterized protein n=1 Tax=Streptosporangium roseum (strain ATCC 12428 / DSM 43021 / JCM 3005 / KCTC 9067 / NCIMB 10171 / NRRL 2505 / NI 9100) TaxID=479432 RepID=D2AW59_STRRD|nr:hypothetical protein [Streptosporangium roseum]ACZ85012.1 hypothetical protein Sros_2024 [Streptosporangium roseum DSM 43021]